MNIAYSTAPSTPAGIAHDTLLGRPPRRERGDLGKEINLAPLTERDAPIPQHERGHQGYRA